MTDEELTDLQIITDLLDMARSLLEVEDYDPFDTAPSGAWIDICAGDMRGKQFVSAYLYPPSY